MTPPESRWMAGTMSNTGREQQPDQEKTEGVGTELHSAFSRAHAAAGVSLYVLGQGQTGRRAFVFSSVQVPHPSGSSEC